MCIRLHYFLDRFLRWVYRNPSVEAFLNRLAFFAVFFLLFLASAVFADPGVYQNNKKAVLYLGSAPPVVDGNVADWAGLLGTSPEKFAYGKLRATKDPSAVIVWRTDNRKLFIYAEVTDSVANENDLPAPLAPSGLSGEGDSRWIISTRGTSVAMGSR